MKYLMVVIFSVLVVGGYQILYLNQGNNSNHPLATEWKSADQIFIEQEINAIKKRLVVLENKLDK
ncbi:hypothetical protein [Chromohalobacter israelensis]|uniref:hypothetical protein n=1 Tax=Chromohalobacter israelensis TaxID=141390 RepID=UPI000D9BE54E|nr:hypothetical protein [Chromohalobacter salexigens]PWW33403.1 hypothetical protein DFO74_12639 [Chromohalobacter salexigens]